MTENNIEKGEVSLHPNGFGFARSLCEEDFFIRPSIARELLTGDWISFNTRRGKRPDSEDVANVISLERPRRFMLGTLFREGDRYRLDPDEVCFVAVYVQVTEPVAEGEVVAVQIEASQVPSRTIETKMVKNLGFRDKDGFDNEYALYKFGLMCADYPDEDAEAIAEASQLDSDVLAYRTRGWADMRDIPFVTIDGESTMDIDDAVHVKAFPLNGTYSVDVAIADVSAYIKPGSALDKYAARRATSVYLPTKTVHMLPESLSAGLASLKCGEPRLAIVCRMHVDGTGTIHVSRFTRAVVTSRERLTYAQVAKRMQDGSALSTDQKVEKSLDAMQALYLELAKNRRARGVLDLNEKEPKLFIREDAQQDIRWEARNDAHKLIEELMLLANKAAAETFTLRKVPALYRHQGPPLAEKWEELKSALAEKGIVLAGRPSMLALAGVVEKTLPGAERQHVESIIRQVFKRAVYHNESPDHFSLGFAAYTHFTSPIRRYSDLLVHRLILGEEISTEKLLENTERCSDRSWDAKRTERFLWDRVKKRILFRDSKNTEALTGMILFSSPKRIKVVLNQWNCIALVPGEYLEKHGYTWNDTAKHWVKGSQLECGAQVAMRVVELIEEKGNCELVADLVESC